MGIAYLVPPRPLRQPDAVQTCDDNGPFLCVTRAHLMSPAHNDREQTLDRSCNIVGKELCTFSDVPGGEDRLRDDLSDTNEHNGLNARSSPVIVDSRAEHKHNRKRRVNRWEVVDVDDRVLLRFEPESHGGSCWSLVDKVHKGEPCALGVWLVSKSDMI